MQPTETQQEPNNKTEEDESGKHEQSQKVRRMCSTFRYLFRSLRST